MDEYTIQELSDLTGVPRRTIHFYTQQEILPPPEGAGLSTRYREIHLVRLKLIPILRQEGLRLDQIRNYYKSQSLPELEKRLTNAKTSQKASPGSKQVAAPQGKALVNFSLPEGITLLVPAEFASKEPERVTKLIATIQEMIEK
jgi:DNA-binding transcriptional MerR regulator